VNGSREGDIGVEQRVRVQGDKRKRAWKVSVHDGLRTLAIKILLSSAIVPPGKEQT
jgi:hypothetical protein